MEMNICIYMVNPLLLEIFVNVYPTLLIATPVTHLHPYHFSCGRRCGYVAQSERVIFPSSIPCFVANGAPVQCLQRHYTFVVDDHEERKPEHPFVLS